MSTNPEVREAVVREALSWTSTPYVNCGAVKGLEGAVDCAMLLCCIFAAVGLIPADFDPRPYNPQWHLHQDETLYLFGLEQWAHRVDLPGPRQQPLQIGDVIMYRFGKHASHGAILVSEDVVIHAHKQAGKVVLCERSLLVDRESSYWSVFT